MDNSFVSAVVPGLIGGTVVAVVAAFLARRQSRSEIETAQLLEAYSLLQDAIAFTADDVDEVSFADLNDAEKVEMADKLGRAVVILDLLGSKRILRAIRSTTETSDAYLRTFDITLVQGELRQHIRRKLGLSVSGIPNVLAVPTSAAMQRMYAQAETRDSNPASQDGERQDGGPGEQRG